MPGAKRAVNMLKMLGTMVWNSVTQGVRQQAFPHPGMSCSMPSWSL